MSNKFNLVGIKIGMINLFTRFGDFIPLTLVKIYNNYIINFKLNNNINYYIKTFNIINNKKINNSELYNSVCDGYLINYKLVKECKISRFFFKKINRFNILPLNILYINQYVNITSFSIGKGFSGVVKKYNFKSNRSTHGNSKAHNKPGSTGMCQDPGRVFLGKKMPGKMGFKKKTLVKLLIFKIDFVYNIIYIKGSIPGKKNILFIKPFIYL